MLVLTLKSHRRMTLDIPPSTVAQRVIITAVRDDCRIGLDAPRTISITRADAIKKPEVSDGDGLECETEATSGV